ncbi:MAG: hypothetical protein OEY59_10225 [Deltaproteobacteria bacterium]|nr:hypothetical protein [Deltaproteobacteria bacterium]
MEDYKLRPQAILTKTALVTGLFLVILVLKSPGILAKSTPAKGISIKQIVVGQETLQTSSKQLIEVQLRNVNTRSATVIVKLFLTLPNHSMISYKNKKVKIPSRSDLPVLFTYPIGKNGGGDYTVAAKVYSLKGKILYTSTKKQEQFFFAKDPRKKHNRPRRGKYAIKESIKTNSKKLKVISPIKFDPPDLKWKEIKVLTPSVLRGETTHLRLILVNDGGDVAKNVEYSLSWFFSKRPARKIPFNRDFIQILAPGEKKILEIPVTIPAEEQKGEYLVQAIIDESNVVKELNEGNNVSESEKPITYGDVALVFPEEAYSFAEEGLFQFEWRSEDYNQFKVQISTNAAFTDLDEIFELPKGQYSPSKKLIPLKGEMPTLALALMESSNLDHLFWRVVAKNSQGKVTESESRKFYITLKPETKSIPE